MKCRQLHPDDVGAIIMGRVFRGPLNQPVAFVGATIEVAIALGSAQLVQAQLKGG